MLGKNTPKNIKRQCTKKKVNTYLKKQKKKLFESQKVLATGSVLPAPDAKTIFTKALQILLDKNFRQCLETIMVSKKNHKSGYSKTPLQKTYEINVG